MFRELRRLQLRSPAVSGCLLTKLLQGDPDLREAFDALRSLARVQAGRDVEPTAAIIDSQSVKTTESSGLSGYDAGRKIEGRKRHIAVDVEGNPIAVRVHTADVQIP